MAAAAERHAMRDRDRQTGTIRDWNDRRGFGFIVADGESGEIFAHISAVVDGEPLAAGQRVSFLRRLNPRSNKIEAQQVEIL